mmetsp:Transcript_560/g.1247  ORF Transcript_560/g.1247 Transcript_560/m.1247 type:complete len:83 (-) Transcript_560:1037-1285(-)
MHPPLKVHQHPHCKEQIEALLQCHKDYPVSKFWGVCTDVKVALDKCFREEKTLRRAANMQKAKAERERLRKRLDAQDQAASR